MMLIYRFVLATLFLPYLAMSRLLLKYRDRYGMLLENRLLNITLVAIYNALCYLLVLLPGSPRATSFPTFLANPGASQGFSITGKMLIVLAAVVMVISVAQRRAVGVEDVKTGLLTSGVYRYVRHPIYAAIICMSLGMALASLNWDGLLMVPVIVLANVAQAAIEEKYDMGVRFPFQYAEYKERTRMIGPIWFWAGLTGLLLLQVFVLPHL